MQMIEAKLMELKIDPANVRQTDKAPDEGLLASIREKGLLIPLTVRKNGAGYLVTDGGMRLQALHILARDGDYNKETPIPCVLREDDEATAADVSLTTNYIRTAMHPVDEFEAFAKLVDTGKTPEAIAKDYGLSPKSVKQSLALGRLAPEVRAAWRKGDLDEDEAGAFTLETDLKRQAAILKKVGKHTSRYEIRNAILGESHQTAGLLRMVGLDAYKAAGGPTTEDLFTHENNPAIVATDLKLLKTLADEKIAATIERLKGEGWKWVSDGSDLPDSARWWDSLPKNQIKAEDRIKYGVLVSQQHSGELEIKYGLQKPSEKKATEKKPAAKGEAAAPTISAALCGRITDQITKAAAEVLTTDGTLALAIVAAALTCYDSPVNIEGGSSKAAKFAAQLVLMRKKSAADLHKVLADVAADSISIGAQSQDNLPLAKNSDNDRALLEALDPKKLNAALRNSFDAADYFAGVTAQACKEAIALCDPKQPITGKEKKSDLAKLAADLVKKSNAGGKAGYLPPEMRTSKYDGPAPAKPAAKAKAAKKRAR
jgi:ParB family transcriptional regulator, chromosome partitioning protein